MIRFTPDRPILEQLSGAGLEFDQKLRRALEIAASRPDLQPEDFGFPDSYLTLALYRTNTILTRIVTLNESRFNVFHDYKLAPPCEVSEVHPGRRLCSVLNRAVELATPSQTIGVGHFLRAVVSLTLDQEAEDLSWLGFPGQVSHKTFSAETLLWGLGHSAWTPLSEAPEVRSILEALDNRDPLEDLQYLVALEGERVVLRPTSVLDAYRMASGTGELTNRLAVLSHFKDQYGGILPSELLELEDLLNSRSTKESDLQRFFERHPNFLRKWEFRDVYSQVYLTREEQGPLIPDFILVDPDVQAAMLLDLKLPHKRVVTRRKNRIRFSSAVEEARAQILEYRDWFEDAYNRRKLRERFGLEIYRPRIGVVIGRRADFQSEFERQLLSSRTDDLEVYTYDDILAYAERRLLLVRRAIRNTD